MTRALWTILVVTLAWTAPLIAQPPAKRVLQPSDLTFVGEVKLFHSFNSNESYYCRGLAHRYVNGQLRFFTAGHDNPTTTTQTRDGEILEFTIPPQAQWATVRGSVVKFWGDIYQDKMVLGPAKSVLRTKPHGLYWDEPTQRLYWSYLGGGDDAYLNYPTSWTLGASTLNESTGIGTAIGAWRIGPITVSGTVEASSFKAVGRGVVPIPTWFQPFVGGKRFAVGFGGYFSLMTQGRASMGPALFAIDAPTDVPHLGTVSSTVLMSNSPVNQTPYTAPWRGERDADYHTTFDNWQPVGSIGYWTWYDEIHQNLVWIDLPDVHGILVFARLGTGNVYYQTSERHADGASNQTFCYDPLKLLEVLQGTRGPDRVTPSWFSDTAVDTRKAGTVPASGARVWGATFDAITNRLYVLVARAYVSPTSNHGSLLVYQVSGAASSRPVAPSRLQVIES